MKRTGFAVGLVVLVFGIGILAQTQTQSAEQELIKLEQQWGDALVKAHVGTPPGLLSAKEDEMPTEEVVRSNSIFAVKLYCQLAAENPGKNLVLSPFSISSALAMTAEGARGKTAKEMETVLGFPESAGRMDADAGKIPWQTSVIRSGMGELNNNLFESQNIWSRFLRLFKRQPYRLSLANALWIEKSYPLRPEFLAAIATYNAGAFLADFRGAPEDERMTINKWVEAKTEDKIKGLLSEGEISTLTRLVLTNAIYFRGDWANQFSRELTREADFTLADGSQAKVPMMANRSSFPYARFDNFAAIEMPYRGDRLSMLVLLPDKNDGLPALEKKLDNSHLEEWIGKLQKRKVEVRFPRFTSEQEFNLSGALQAMGMKEAFAPTANFTGLSDSPGPDGLFIGVVAHKSFIQVDEQGTKAAAATAVSLTLGIEIPLEFAADHPFIYLIRDIKTGLILFLGSMEDPKA